MFFYLTFFLISTTPYWLTESHLERFHMYNHLPISLSHWIRQSDAARNVMDERVYEIRKLAREPGERDLIIAQTSKQSAQRLIAALSEQQTKDRYRVSVFVCPVLPTAERWGMER